MRRLKTTAGLAVGLLAASAAAQADKVGVVDMNQLMQNAPQAEAARAAIEEAFGPAQQEMQQKRREYQELAEQLERDGLVMDESEQQEMRERMGQLEQELRQMDQQFGQQLGQQRQRVLARLQQLIAEEVQVVAEEEGYDVVVGQGVLYARDTVDLTDQVMERLEERGSDDS